MSFLVGFAWGHPPRLGWEESTPEGFAKGWREEILWMGWIGLVYEKRKLY
jgi:hypothetical protein